MWKLQLVFQPIHGASACGCWAACSLWSDLRAIAVTDLWCDQQICSMRSDFPADSLNVERSNRVGAVIVSGLTLLGWLGSHLITLSSQTSWQTDRYSGNPSHRPPLDCVWSLRWGSELCPFWLLTTRRLWCLRLRKAGCILHLAGLSSWTWLRNRFYWRSSSTQPRTLMIKLWFMR